MTEIVSKNAEKSSAPVAKLRPCTGCKVPFIAVADGLCPDCEKDSEFYRLSRKKGFPREFLPYSELFQQWKARRKECSEWRKVAEQAAKEREARYRVELEKSYLLIALTTMGGNLDPALALAEELDKTRKELERERARSEYNRRRLEELESGKTDRWESLLTEMRELSECPSFPKGMLRRLIQLCHPDKHGGSTAAIEATKWLLSNRGDVRP